MRWFKFLILAGLLLCQSCKGDKGTTTPDPSLLPSITAVTPAQVSRGRDGINGRIQGTNFSNDALVDMGQGIHVKNVNVRSTTEIGVNFDVSADAAPGQRNVVVTTITGTSNPFLMNVTGNRAPIAAFTVTPSSGGQGTLFSFDGSGSSDPDGNITAYDWDFGDNQKATGAVVTHQFTTAGSFRVSLKVTDNQSAVDRLIRDLQVDQQGNLPPQAQFVVTPQSGDPSTTFHFDGSSSSDPDGQISQYIWDFGDGATANGPTADHKYTSAARYKVKLTVLDNAGGEAFVEKYLDV
jgi:PKD repeat protein